MAQRTTLAVASKDHPGCPPWCDRSFLGNDHDSSLLHETTLVRMTVNHGVMTGQQASLHLYIERYDEPDAAATTPTEVMLAVSRHNDTGSSLRAGETIRLTAPELRTLAAAYLKAAALLEATR